MRNIQLMSNYLNWFGKTNFYAVFAASASIAIVGTALSLAFPLLSILMEQREISATIIGANVTISGLGSVLIIPFTIPIARMVGIVNTIIVCLILTAACLIGFYIFPSITVWFILRFIYNALITIIFVLSEFWINSAADENKRGLILGIYATVLGIGFAIGPGILIYVGSNGILPFAIGSILILLAIFPVAIARNNQPIIAKKPLKSVFRYVFIVPLATGAVLLFGILEQAGLGLFPVYGARLLVSETEISLMLLVMALGNVMLQIPLGILSDRVTDRRVILLGCAIIAGLGALFMPLMVGSSLLALGLLLFIWGGVVTGLYTVGLAHLGSRLSGNELAQANASFIMCYALGMTIGPYLVGLSTDLINPHGYAWSLFVFCCCYTVLIALRWNRR